MRWLARTSWTVVLCALGATLPQAAWAQHGVPDPASAGGVGPASASSVLLAPPSAVDAARKMPAAVAPPAPIPLAGAQAQAVRVSSSAQAWGGARTATDGALSDRVVAYRIDAELDAAKHAVNGREQLQWRNRSSQPVDRIYLHLYLNAFQGEGSTFFTERRLLTAHGQGRGNAQLKAGEWGGIVLKQLQQGAASLRWRYVHPDGGPASDHTVAEVGLAEAVPPGGTLTLDMEFVSQLPRVVERTGWWGDFNLVAQWFPKIGVLELPGERGATAPRWNVHEFHFNSEFYADFGSYDVRLTVPADYVVGAVGQQVDDLQTPDGKHVYHFQQADVHDFAWVAARGFRQLSGSYPGARGAVTVRVLYPPEYAASAAPVLKATLDSLSYFSGTLGDYPYRTVTAVVPPYNAQEAGGMEYPTFFTVDGYSKPEAGSLDGVALDFVTIHEFGHGYFYGILASNEFEEPMLDEGLNEYWDMRMLRERGEAARIDNPLLRWLGWSGQLRGFEFERLGASLAQPADPLGQNSWNRLSSSSYGSIYSRTALVMHDLEARVGSAAMERAFKAYYQRWWFRHPSIADLRDSLAEGTGQPAAVDAAFDAYVYGTATQQDRVSSIDVEAVTHDDAGTGDRRDASSPGAAQEDGSRQWRSVVTVQRAGVAVPQRLTVHFSDGSQQQRRWNDGQRWARFSFVGPAKVVSAELDAQHQQLLDDNRLDNSLTRQPDPRASRRWGIALLTALQNFYALVVSL